jgi:diguanylate cyclase (GGDEF)-like protein
MVMFKSISDWLSKPRHLPLVFAFIMAIVGLGIYGVLLHAQDRVIELETLRVGEIVTNQALSARSVYAAEVAEKLQRDGFGVAADFADQKGYGPLPAQFLKMTSHASRGMNDGLYSYRPLSKWNLDATQGLTDDFQKWAWSQFELQDQQNPQGPIKWKPMARFEVIDGVKILRYMRADAASNTTCVDCHNALEKSDAIVARRVAAGVALGKQWKQHQLLGAIEADIPVDKVEFFAGQQATAALLFTLAFALCGLAVAGFLAINDVRSHRRLAAQFSDVAKTDPVTRLGNRLLFNEVAQAALSAAGQHHLAFLFIDLDGFKPINDDYGHHIGDAALKEIGDRLIRSIRDIDLVVRQGGDEFIVLLQGSSIRIDSLTVAEKLLHAINDPIMVDGHQFTVSASIGISLYPEHGDTLATLMERADAAMYDAKRAGKGCIRIWGRQAPTCQD